MGTVMHPNKLAGLYNHAILNGKPIDINVAGMTLRATNWPVQTQTHTSPTKWRWCRRYQLMRLLPFARSPWVVTFEMESWRNIKDVVKVIARRDEHDQGEAFGVVKIKEIINEDAFKHDMTLLLMFETEWAENV
jgi:hypothetical protein